MHERCFDKRSPARARNTLEWSRPLARDRVNDVRSRDGVLEIRAGYEGRRQDAVECSADPSAADREEEKANALVSQLHGARRSGVDVERHPGPAPRRPKTHERHVMMALRQGAGEGARLRFGTSDGREELLRDYDAHGVVEI